MSRTPILDRCVAAPGWFLSGNLSLVWLLRLDECLWRSVDLEGLIHVGLALQRVLRTGVRRLRCPRSFMEELLLPDVRSV